MRICKCVDNLRKTPVFRSDKRGALRALAFLDEKATIYRQSLFTRDRNNFSMLELHLSLRCERKYFLDFRYKHEHSFRNFNSLRRSNILYNIILKYIAILELLFYTHENKLNKLYKIISKKCWIKVISN